MKKLGIIFIVLLGVVAISIIPMLSRDKSDRDQVTISEEFMNIDVKVKNAKVEVLPSDSDHTEIQLTEKEKDYYLHTKVKGDTLEVEVKKDRFFRWFQFDIFSAFSHPTLVIYLPERDFDLIQVEADNGKVELNDVSANEVNVEADNGELNLTDIHASAVTAQTDNGRIKFNDVEGKIVGKTDNGKISLNTKTLDQAIELETDNGVIEVWTEKEPTNNTFDIKTDNGPIKVFGSSTYDTIIGDGEYLIKLKTDNGKITVDKK